MRLAIALLAMTVCVSAAAQAQQQDFSQVQIKTTKIAGNFYTLDGSGGTIGVLAGPDGVLMVDTQFAPLGDKIVAAIKQISDGRIRYLVNTHVHPDHIGGNENIGKQGATIFARENLRGRMLKPNPQANGQPGVPAPAMALPTVTYDAPITFHVNGEEVRLIPVPAAHTDGDTMVVPGHGVVVDKTAVAAHKAMMMAVRDKVAALVRQNKTQEEVIASKPTAEFDAKVTGSTPMTADRFVGQLYQELKTTR
jgi:cyclase